jgi:SnoaL-like domain
VTLGTTGGRCARCGAVVGSKRTTCARSRTAAGIRTGGYLYAPHAICLPTAPGSRDTARAMSQENVELVTRFHPGSGTDLVALAHDETAWGAAEGAVAPFLEPDFTLDTVILGQRTRYTGLEGFRQGWLDWLGPWSSYYDELEEAVDLGERVLLLGHHRGQRRDTNAEVEMFAAAIYTVRDGKVTHVEYYFDRAEALEAAGLSDG